MVLVSFILFLSLNEVCPFVPVCFGLRCCALVQQPLILNVVYGTLNVILNILFLLGHVFIKRWETYWTKTTGQIQTHNMVSISPAGQPVCPFLLTLAAHGGFCPAETPLSPLKAENGWSISQSQFFLDIMRVFSLYHRVDSVHSVTKTLTASK